MASRDELTSALAQSLLDWDRRTNGSGVLAESQWRDAAEAVMGLPEEVAQFLESMTGYREEVNSGSPNEWGESVRDEADQAAELCRKYGVRFTVGYEDDLEDGRSRQVFSDGTKGEWE